MTTTSADAITFMPLLDLYSQCGPMTSPRQGLAPGGLIVWSSVRRRARYCCRGHALQADEHYLQHQQRRRRKDGQNKFHALSVLLIREHRQSCLRCPDLSTVHRAPRSSMPGA
jgi:hypothetical protein